MASLSSVAWAYAVMRPGDTRLFAAVFAHADAVLGGPARATENESEGDDCHWQDVGRRSQDGLQSREEENEEPGMESNDIRSMRQVGALLTEHEDSRPPLPCAKLFITEGKGWHWSRL